MKQNIKTYDLVWIVDGKIKETILTRKPYGICVYEKNNRKSSTHKTGLLQIRKNK